VCNGSPATLCTQGLGDLERRELAVQNQIYEPCGLWQRLTAQLRPPSLTRSGYGEPTAFHEGIEGLLGLNRHRRGSLVADLQSLNR